MRSKKNLFLNQCDLLSWNTSFNLVQIVKAMLYLKIMSAVLDIEPDRRVLTIPMKSGFTEVEFSTIIYLDERSNKIVLHIVDFALLFWSCNCGFPIVSLKPFSS